MSEFKKVADVGELSDPGKQLVEVDDRLVVLIHIGGEYFCLDDICTHDGGPLGEGELKDHAIACPRHGAEFDVRTGKARTMPATEDTLSHDVKVEADGVYVRLAAQADASPADPAPAPTSSQPASGDGGGEFKSLNEDVVREELKKVIDPELFVNIVDLGLIYGIDLKDNEGGQADVLIDMTMTSPACPAGPQLIANSRQVVSQLAGVGDVEVKIVMDPPWTPDKMTDDARDQLGIF